MNAVVKKIKKCSIQISGVSQYTPEQQQKHCEPILLTYKLKIKKKNSMMNPVRELYTP